MVILVSPSINVIDLKLPSQAGNASTIPAPLSYNTNATWRAEKDE